MPEPLPTHEGNFISVVSEFPVDCEIQHGYLLQRLLCPEVTFVPVSQVISAVVPSDKTYQLPRSKSEAEGKLSTVALGSTVQKVESVMDIYQE